MVCVTMSIKRWKQIELGHVYNGKLWTRNTEEISRGKQIWSANGGKCLEYGILGCTVM